MDSTSRVPAILGFLVTLFQDADTLGQAALPVAVYDGPMVTADPGMLALWVGVDDIDTDTPLAAESNRQWASYADQNETITIHCVAGSRSGSNDITARRTAAYGIVAAVEELIRGDTTRFGDNGAVGSPGVTGSRLRQGGGEARVSFEIILTVL